MEGKAEAEVKIILTFEKNTIIFFIIQNEYMKINQ